MKVEFRLNKKPSETIRQLGGTRLEHARSELVRDAMTRTLQQVIEENPVDTARSRAAWVSGLEELGGSPPAGWEGPHPTAIDAGRQLGESTLSESGEKTTAIATNAVPYVVSLEYGTSRRSPIAMVRRALLRVAGQLQGLFRL